MQVKELECIVDSMLATGKDMESTSLENEDANTVLTNVKSRPSGERCHKMGHDSSSESKADQTLENNIRINYSEDDVDNSLYDAPDSVNEIAPISYEEEPESSENSLDASLENETSKYETDDDEDDNHDEESSGHEFVSPSSEDNLKTTSLQARCHLSTNSTTQETSSSLNENSLHNHFDTQELPSIVGECSKVYTHKKRKFVDKVESSHDELFDFHTEASIIDDTFVEDSSDCTNSLNKIDKCLKVYTPKRRISLDEKKCRASDICDSIEEPTSTSCIDLSNDSTCSNTPVTLPASLEMETSDYIWNLSSESIQYVVGCTINQSSALSSSVDLEKTNNKQVRQMKELFSVDNGNSDIATPPVLRRSVRINQLENDETISDNGMALITPKVRDKQAVDVQPDDFSSNGIVTTSKTKRKITKDTDSRVSDENNVSTSQNLRKTTNNSRSLRSTSQHASRKSTGKKEEQKSKGCGKTKSDKTVKNDIDNCDILVPTRLNTIASVDRALWGDMSDVLENRENGEKLLSDYSTSKEIPFAVGLLPLRAALERMQATLDHQPRKTRSSVAPLRHYLNGLKRKVSINDTDLNVAAKKSHTSSDSDVDTVCHIEIRTASSQCSSESSRDSSNEQMVAVGSTSETDRR